MSSLPAFWLRESPLSRLLSPLAWLFAVLVTLRRRLYLRGLLPSVRVGVPVVVVGNIFIGGTGKTPLVGWLSRELAERGYRPGIVCRGYGGRSREWPRVVTAQSDPGEVGDEPLLLAASTGLPVVAGPDRVADARTLTGMGCDCLVLDDGLQHYRLARDEEWLVLDAARRLGNGRCLPAGPLREPLSRLRTVDCVIANGDFDSDHPGYRLEPGALVSLDGRRVELSEWRGRSVHAVAGIGHPERFFGTLEAAGLTVARHPFPDHHAYRRDDLSFGDDRPVVMTEKDAVKCRGLAGLELWYLPVHVVPNRALERARDALLERMSQVG